MALPEAGTEPAPGVIETDVAPVTSQSRVELSPSLMVAGLAVNNSITGAEDGESEAVEPEGVEPEGGEVPATVIVTSLVTLPASFVVVMV